MHVSERSWHISAKENKRVMCRGRQGMIVSRDNGNEANSNSGRTKTPPDKDDESGISTQESRE